MKQELTITVDVPAGQKAYWDGNSVVFVNNDLAGLPKTWEEFCGSYDVRVGESCIDIFSNISTIANDKSRDMCIDKNLLPSKQDAEAHLAIMQLHQLRDCYRKGWKPNSSDGYKYCIERNDKGYSVCMIDNVSTFLTFQTGEIANAFLDNFKELIEMAGDLI